LSDVFFVSDDEGWMSISNEAIILHTSDGGETFEIQTTQYPTEAIYMIDENEGYAGGANGRVYRTTDGGENWIAIGSISVTLTDIDFATTTQGYCCGDDGAVFSITPQGVENLNSGLASNLNGISAASVNNVWIVGAGNIVYYNGTTFDFQTGPVGTYNSIYFIDDDEGWVNGNSGILGHTENGGTTWTPQINPDLDRRALYDLFFQNENKGWAVGYDGIILKTSDGGNNWNIEGEGLSSVRLRGVHFTSATNGYVVGNGKTLLKYGELTGTHEVTETLQFEIFPNPAASVVSIQSVLFSQELATIEITDMQGRKLREKQIPAGTEEIEIDVSSLKNGVYFCKLITEKGNATKKLIIQK
jgi:photosystem II stability/assembly factor-like uncharacterized protein